MELHSHPTSAATLRRITHAIRMNDTLLAGLRTGAPPIPQAMNDSRRRTVIDARDAHQQSLIRRMMTYDFSITEANNELSNQLAKPQDSHKSLITAYNRCEKIHSRTTAEEEVNRKEVVIGAIGLNQGAERELEAHQSLDREDADEISENELQLDALMTDANRLERHIKPDLRKIKPLPEHPADNDQANRGLCSQFKARFKQCMAEDYRQLRDENEVLKTRIDLLLNPAAPHPVSGKNWSDESLGPLGRPIVGFLSEPYTVLSASPSELVVPSAGIVHEDLEASTRFVYKEYARLWLEKEKWKNDALELRGIINGCFDAEGRETIHRLLHGRRDKIKPARILPDMTFDEAGLASNARVPSSLSSADTSATLLIPSSTSSKPKLKRPCSAYYTVTRNTRLLETLKSRWIGRHSKPLIEKTSYLHDTTLSNGDRRTLEMDDLSNAIIGMLDGMMWRRSLTSGR
jgi:hypothetical protein